LLTAAYTELGARSYSEGYSGTPSISSLSDFVKKIKQSWAPAGNRDLQQGDQRKDEFFAREAVRMAFTKRRAEDLS
jgi:hypothetical protein